VKNFEKQKLVDVDKVYHNANEQLLVIPKIEEWWNRFMHAE
jgi:hypothetical protein